MKNLCLSGVAICFATMSYANAETAWDYKEIKDIFTDKTHHVASIHVAPATNALPLSSDSFKANFECRNGKEFVFALYGKKILGKRNEPFKVQYRVDDKHSKTIRMHVFSNTETGGMNEFSAIDIANDVLNADRLRLRVFATNGDQFDSEVSLENARRSILKTVEACGLYLRD